MSKESQSQPVIGRASASLENVGTGLLEWTLNDNVCNTRIEGLASHDSLQGILFAALQHAGVVCYTSLHFSAQTAHLSIKIVIFDEFCG